MLPGEEGDLLGLVALPATAAAARAGERTRALVSSLALHAGAVAVVLFTGAVAGPPRATRERILAVLPTIVKTVPVREAERRAPVKPLVMEARRRFTAPPSGSRSAVLPALPAPAVVVETARRAPDIPTLRIEPVGPPPTVPAPAVRTDNFADIRTAPAAARAMVAPGATGSFDRAAVVAPAASRNGAATAATSFAAVNAGRVETATPGRVSASGFGAAQSGAPVSIAANRTAVAGAGFGTTSAAPAQVAARTQGTTPAGFGNAGAGSVPQAGVRPAPVAAAGFGASVGDRAVARSTRGRVEQAAFGDMALPAKPERMAQAMVEAPLNRSLTILDKPRPAYTDEGRRLQIEGDVVIEAEFTAEGVVRVLRVLHGLGHGLDENAVAAARAIRFRPAERNGRPVDAVAVVRLAFQLAF